MADDSRRPFPQLNSFRPFVSQQLNTKRTQWPVPVIAPFLRLTSCNSTEEVDGNNAANAYKYFTLGLHGFDLAKDVNLFDLTYGSSRDIVGYGYAKDSDGKYQKKLIASSQITYQSPKNIVQATPEQIAIISQRNTLASNHQSHVTAAGSQPIPAISSITVKRSGLAAPLIAQVQWKCYNQNQLEFLRYHFLCTGTYLVLEWGQQYSNNLLDSNVLDNQVNTILDFSMPSIDQTLMDVLVKGRRYTIENYVQPTQGNYDFIVGQVGNFKINVEADTNTYMCTTEVVSMGENLWAMGSTIGMVQSAFNKDDPRSATVTSIHGYFGESTDSNHSPFDILLNSPSMAANVAIPPNLPAMGKSPMAADTSVNQPNVNNDKFISWNGLIYNVLDDIIQHFSYIATDPDSNGANKAMASQFQKELRSLLGLGAPPRQEIMHADDFTDRADLFRQEWVGNHVLLRSTDPNIMLVITGPVASDNKANDAYLSTGIFGQIPDDQQDPRDNSFLAYGDRGKLSQGIWLNVKCVREAFTGTNTLVDALKKILEAMNSAVAGYWALQLFYDEEYSMYRIIDYNFDMHGDDLSFYVFNSKYNAQHNETLDIQFDSAFPPELIAQMSIMAMVQTSSPAEQAQLAKDMPLIQNTSPFMFAVNWTNTKDILKEKLQQYRQSEVLPAVDAARVFSVTDNNELASTHRITEDQWGGGTSMTKELAFTPSTNRAIPGSPPPTAPDLPITAPKPTTTVKPTLAPVANPQLQVIIPQFASGGDAKLGTLAYRNNNPGNIRGSSGAGGFAAYPTPEDGFKAIISDLQSYIAKNPSITLGDTIKKYAPPSQNDTAKYTNTVSTNLSTPTSAPLSSMNLEDVAKQIAKIESNTTVYGSVNASNTSSSTSSTGQSSSTTPPITPTTTSAPAPSSTPTNAADISTDSTNADYLKKIKDRFGTNIINFIYRSKSELRNLIVNDGYKNLGKASNAFISPFPTTTSVTVKIPGQAGISIADGFMVDKLPFIFEDFGIFQVVELVESVTEGGWYTTIRGYFKLMFPTGTGGKRLDGTTPTATPVPLAGDTSDNTDIFNV